MKRLIGGCHDATGNQEVRDHRARFGVFLAKANFVRQRQRTGRSQRVRMEQVQVVGPDGNVKLTVMLSTGLNSSVAVSSLRLTVPESHPFSANNQHIRIQKRRPELIKLMLTQKASKAGQNRKLPESKGEAPLGNDIESCVLTGPGRIRTFDQWIMSPLL